MKAKLTLIVILLLLAIVVLVAIGLSSEVKDAQRDPLATCFRECEDKYVSDDGVVLDEYNYGKCIDGCLRANVCAG